MTEQTHSQEAHAHATGAHGCAWCEMAEEMSKLFGARVPEQTREHFRNARVEFLKGLRGLIDARIERLSRTEAKGSRVTVE